MQPASTIVVYFAVIQTLSLLLGYLLGGLARLILGDRVRLSTAGIIILSTIATSASMLVVGWFVPNQTPISALPLTVAFIANLLVIAVFAGIAARVQVVPDTPVPALIARGESSALEFKSTARWNLRTSQRDDKMETTIAKSVAGFLNADGGTLLIGVDDRGVVLGLGNDLATLRQADADRFELWLRDLLATKLGLTAAALPRISFDHIGGGTDDHLVCRLACPSSPEPVFLRAGKGSEPQFVVRVGNSTRQLPADETVSYVTHRWPVGFAANALAHVRAVVRTPVR